MRQQIERTLLSRKEIAVMSPDRFWCQGLVEIIRNGRFGNVAVYCCHSLEELDGYLREHHNITTILTEEYGDGENMSDWLLFSNRVRMAFPGTGMFMLRRRDRAGIDLIPHRRQRGYLDMISSVESTKKVLCAIFAGRLTGEAPPLWGAVLTPREMYILKCLCHAETPVKLGKRLGINVKTISAHKASALRKLGLKRLASLLGRYNGLIPLANKKSDTSLTG